MPCGFDDRFAVPVLVGEVSGHREMRDARVPDLQDVDVADIPSDFDSNRKIKQNETIFHI